MSNAMKSLGEESRTLLREIVENHAWRQLSSMNILGHCLKYVTKVDSKVLVAQELHNSLLLFQELRGIYGELGWTDVVAAVRDRLAEVPYPASRLEFGVCHYLVDQAQLTSMKSYVDCVVPEFAAVARSYVDAASTLVPSGDPVFVEYAGDASHRPHAQSMFDRWVGVALSSFGPASQYADRRPVELGLRAHTKGELVRTFLAAIDPWRQECGLDAPAVAAVGAE